MMLSLHKRPAEQFRYAVNKTLVTKLLAVFLIILAAFQLVLLFGAARSTSLNSDDATEMVYAKLITSQGHWVFADGWICTTEVRVLHFQLIMSILFRFMDNWQLIWATNAVICGIMVFLSAYFLFRVLKLSINESLFFALMFLTPGTSLYKWSCHFPYYSFFLSCTFWILSLYLDIAHNNTQTYRIFKYVLLIFLCVISGVCGVRYAMILFVPLALSDGWLIYRKHMNVYVSCLDFKTVYNENRTLIWMMLAHLAGLALFMTWIQPVYDPYGNTKAVASLVGSWDSVGKNLSFLAERLFYDMLGVQFGRQSLFSKSGISILLQLFLGSIAVLAAYWPRFNMLDEPHRSFTRFAYFQFIATTVILSISASSLDNLLGRYFAIGMTSFYPMIALVICRLPKHTISRIVAFAAAFFYMFILDHNTIHNNGFLPDEPSPPKYIDFLKNSNYTFGEASFWNANKTTYLTNGEIAMISVTATSAAMHPTKWGTPVEYLGKQAEFILLTQDEVAERASNGIPIDESKIVYQDEKYVIYAGL